MNSSYAWRELGHTTYHGYLSSPHWYEVKKAMYRKYGKRGCRLCGKRFSLNIHHLTYNTLGHEKLGRDVVLLCEKCHKRCHYPLIGKKIPLEPKYLRRQYRMLWWTKHIRNFRLGSAINAVFSFVFE